MELGTWALLVLDFASDPAMGEVRLLAQVQEASRTHFLATFGYFAASNLCIES